MGDSDAKKKRFGSLFKSKDNVKAGSATTTGSKEGDKNSNQDEPTSGGRGGRRKLFTQLSESEKSTRRSTLGSASLAQYAQQPTSPTAASQASNSVAASGANGPKQSLFGSNPTHPTSPHADLETPFAKMVRQSKTEGASGAGSGVAGGSSNDLITTSIVGTGKTMGMVRDSSGGSIRSAGNSGGNSSSEYLLKDSTGSISKRSTSGSSSNSLTLSAEEKKSRRKSLLAPLFSSGESSSSPDLPIANSVSNNVNGSSDSITNSAGKDPGKSKKKGGLFGTKRGKELDFQTSLALDDEQAKIQKERQKKLQKEMDKIQKDQAKQDKARQTRLFEVLSQTLELGQDRAQLPMPQHRTTAIAPSRPPLYI